MSIVTPLNKLGEWRLIPPQNYHKFRDILEQYKERAKHIRILIVDDIDADGFGSAKICKTKLSKIFPKCEIYINSRHGFTDLEKGKYYDIVIILDSSSNLVETYESLDQVFILDHHEYDRDLICPPNVCLINSKDTPDLQNISAGMLTYIVMTQFLIDMGIEDYSMFDIACLTLYSDIVPTDKYVQSCLYHFMKQTEYSPLLSGLNIYKDAINKNTILYTIVPLINYTRRLGDKNTLKLLYSDNEELAIRKLIENRKKCKNILDMIDKMHIVGFQGEEFENFTYCDIAYLVDNIPTLPIDKFKGVYANSLSGITNKPVLVGFNVDEEVYFSVRSSNINSLDFFEEHNLVGGGHKSACGFSGLIYELPTILRKYDKYLENAEESTDAPIMLENISDLDKFDLHRVAIYNEFKFSAIKPTRFIVRDIDASLLTNIDQVRYHFTLGNYNFISYKELVVDGKVDIEITPTLSSYTLGTKKLITTICRHIKEDRK